MELRDVHYFAVMAQHGNVRRASEALDLSPGALSKSLRRLEKTIQAKLFDRTSKGVELTPVGAALLAKVRRLQLGFEDVAREAADLAAGFAGHLRVGASPADCEDLPSACTVLMRESPKITFDVTVSDTDVIMPLLHDGKLDVVFNVIPSVPPPGLEQEHLFDDEYVVYASRRHPLANRRQIPMTELMGEAWAVSTASHRPKQILIAAHEEDGLPAPRFAVLTRSVRMRLQMVAGSRLLGFGPRRLVEKTARYYGLRILQVPRLRRARPVGATYRKDAYLSPAARRLIDLFKAAALDG